MSQPRTPGATPGGAEHFDVLIVGAGISGVGSAYHLQQQCPGTSFLVLEALEELRRHLARPPVPRYPLGQRPVHLRLSLQALDGTAHRDVPAEILKYMGEVIADNDLGRRIRYHHVISSASWSSADNRWTLRSPTPGPGRSATSRPVFFGCARATTGTPRATRRSGRGSSAYGGRVVHPQTWPDDLEYAGKDVVVIGSGATAATIVPAIASACGHVTVIQRSPTYFWTGRNVNEVADMLRELDIPEEWTHEIVRRKILHEQEAVTRLSFEAPDFLRDELIKDVRAHLPEGYDVETHFTPRYRPWRQRLAYVPDGDLFEGISSGQVTMVTDEIETFTEKGILLKSGSEVTADIVITATGFDLNVLGDIAFDVDGEPLVFSDTVTYRGMMFTGVPNMAWIFGYFRASWTLRADLVGDFVCRLLNHMKELGATRHAGASTGRRRHADLVLD